MIRTYMRPTAAYNKLRVARVLQQPVYIYGATGYGKTELVRQYLGNRKYVVFSCAESNWELEKLAAEPSDKKTIVVIEDLHLLINEERRQQVVDLAHRQEIWLLMLSRCKAPAWLAEIFLEQNVLIITEEDLSWDRETIRAYLEQLHIQLEEEKLERLHRESEGNAQAVKQTALRLLEGREIGSELTTDVSKIFSDYLERVVMAQWESEVVDFLLQMSVVDSFTLPLAEMITGNARVSSVLERAMETGNFIKREHDVYYIRPILLQALRNQANKKLGTEELRQYMHHAAVYYELQGQDLMALELYERCGSKSGIRNLLIRNAKQHPGNGHYFEMRRFYFQLEESEIEKNVLLMGGMSMLCSMVMDIEKSEYWYQKLSQACKQERGSLRREIAAQLAYLDISLPHRGSAGLLEILQKIPALMFEHGVHMPELSVTSNLPSTMNGGKDFCHWSKRDRELAATIGKLVERVLGRYGKGLVHAALGESLYEKGEDPYEVLSHLSKAQLETEADGRLEIAFAAVGVQVRLYLSDGNSQTAKELLYSFQTKVEKEQIVQILSNLEALRCRIALYEGDTQTIEAWMEQAPDENKEFDTLDRYRYLTKVRCQIAAGLYKQAFALLEKIKFYAEVNDRRYIRMEVGVLTAIVRSRLGVAWQEDFLQTLREIGSYHFIRIVSEEGAAALELLEKVKRMCAEDEKIEVQWLEKLYTETAKMARRYPVYLGHQFAEIPNFSEMALQILRLQADGLSITKIAEALHMNPRTVKYHAQENYRKLQASNKSEALLAARNLNLL